MKIYKFKDSVDGNYAFVMAKTALEAEAQLKNATVIPFVLIDEKSPTDLKKPFIILNQILPF